jgi:hypothetical protein
MTPRLRKARAAMRPPRVAPFIDFTPEGRDALARILRRAKQLAAAKAVKP